MEIVLEAKSGKNPARQGTETVLSRLDMAGLDDGHHHLMSPVTDGAECPEAESDDDHVPEQTEARRC